MGMKTNNNEGRTVLSEINVTPFVDVMLVLLVIFMVTAPILYQGVDVNLPKVESKPMPAAEREKKVVITLNEKGEIFIEKKQYSLSELKVEIRTLVRTHGKRIEDEDVFLRADSNVPYGTVMEVMAEIKKAGVNKLGLVTEPPSVNGSLDK
ncbi:MAG TPA: protein TolR [Thermodesulfobacteriota bacterium]|nr:protein TolR [Thermodesulfobacteriota bacterium]